MKRTLIGILLLACTIAHGQLLPSVRRGVSGGSVTESDPTVSTDIKAITPTQIANWISAYGWGNHASAGYATTSALTTGLAGKEPTITAGTTGQYRRGDKTWQTLDKTAVGLSSVDNTSDADKPVSTATTTALGLKANDNAVVHTTGTETIGGAKTLTSLVSVSAGIVPTVANTGDLGSTTLKFGIAWAGAFINSSSVYYGTTNQAGNILFRFGTTSQIAAGFQATSGRMFLQPFGTVPSDDGVNQLQVSGNVKATQFRISALNTAPSSATDTGTTGEIRFTSTGIYWCIATNTWIRLVGATW